MAEEPSDSSTLPDFDKLWNYEQPEETEKVFRKILPIARASGDSDYLAQLITQIARTNSLRREFEASHSLLDEAEKMLSPETPIGRVRYLLERGRTHNSAQQLQEASTHFREAFELADSLGQDFHAVDAAHMMGIVKKGDIALQWNERAMKVAEASADERAKRWLGALYNNTGWTYHDSGSYERALELFEKGLAWRKERGDGKPTLIRQVDHRANITFIAANGRGSRAPIEPFRRVQGLRIRQDGYVLEEIGECLLTLGKRGESASYFSEAYKLLSKDGWLKAEEPDRLERLKKLGEDRGEGD